MVFIVTCIKPQSFDKFKPHLAARQRGVFSTHSMATNYIMSLVEKHNKKYNQDAHYDSDEEVGELLLDELMNSGGIFVGDDYFKVEELKSIDVPVEGSDDDEEEEDDLEDVEDVQITESMKKYLGVDAFNEDNSDDNGKN